MSWEGRTPSMSRSASETTLTFWTSLVVLTFFGWKSENLKRDRSCGKEKAMEGILSATDKQSMVSSFLEIAVGQTADTARQFLQVRILSLCTLYPSPLSRACARGRFLIMFAALILGEWICGFLWRFLICVFIEGWKEVGIWAEGIGFCLWKFVSFGMAKWKVGVWSFFCLFCI